jgi:hypothetical protein
MAAALFHGDRNATGHQERGHWTAMVKWQPTGQWFWCSDTNIQEVSEQHVEEQVELDSVLHFYNVLPPVT